MSRFLMWPSSCSTIASKTAGCLAWETTAPPLTATIRRRTRPNAKADGAKLRGCWSQVTGPIPARSRNSSRRSITLGASSLVSGTRRLRRRYHQG